MLLSLIFFSASVHSQAQTIAYQGTAISGFGQLLTSQSISVRLSIFNDIASGTAAYVETQTAITSGSGAFSVQVGSGTAVTGTYASINLMSGIHYLQVEIKPSGGSYSTISKGPIAQSVAVGSWQCGSSITVTHTAGAVAPVSKTVTYGTVTNIPGETTKCWITSNLGADHQATAVDDATEASGGWYWQFNRKQGYKNDGSTVTPAWTITDITENSDWQTANDPCSSELGTGWRVPTNTEWTNVDASGNWTDWNGPWNSGLKLHAAGFLIFSNAMLASRGLAGEYMSSSQVNSSSGWCLEFFSGGSYTPSVPKAYGFSVRCIKDPTVTSSLPTITTTSISAIAQTTATGGGNVSADGGATVSARGICWSTSANPSITDIHTTDGSGTGTFVSNITGLSANTLYHVRAYATNSVGTAYGSDISFTTLAPAFTCGTSTLTINHVAGLVAPVSKTVTYGTVTNIPGETTKCWITSNLGADHQATAVSDATEASAGWYWQFNRKQGYKQDGSTLTPAWSINSINETSDWLTANDPCTSELGTGWRLPTSTEWTNVGATGNWTTWTGPWSSGLKLHAAGYLDYNNGWSIDRGFAGNHWSSSQYNSLNGWGLNFNSGYSGMNHSYKALGFSVRCIKD